MCGRIQVYTDKTHDQSHDTEARIGAMAGQAWIRLLFAAALALPSLVQCEYPWPDKVTQHKGYIEVFNSNARTPAICCKLQIHVRSLLEACSQLCYSLQLQSLQ